MILSICPTTTLERNWVIPKFSIGGFYRVQQEFLFASGKGVNVARAIKILNGQVTCTGFVGGFIGELFKSLVVQDGLHGCWTEACTETRESITVFDPETAQDATSFCPYGPAIQVSEWESFVAQIYDLAENVKNVSISGNIPLGINEEHFSALITELSRRGSQVWLDLNGPMLTVGAKATPFAIKVNAMEISELAGHPVHERVETLEISRALRKAYAIPLICVTLGPRGAVCSSDWGDWIIHPVHYSEIVSSIGSGDSFLGGMLVQYERGAPLVECLHAASAAAAANTQQLGPGVFSIEDYKHAFERTVVECASI